MKSIDSCYPSELFLLGQEKLVQEALAFVLRNHLPEFQIQCCSFPLFKSMIRDHEQVPRLIIAGRLNGQEIQQMMSLGLFSAEQGLVKLCLLLPMVSYAEIKNWMKLPVTAILSRSDSVSLIIETVRNAMVGIPHVSEDFSALVEQRKSVLAMKKHDIPPLCELTKRQLEILVYIASGYSVKEISRELHISTKSVDSHKYRLMGKLGIHDRVLLTRFAIREGLLSA